MRGGIDIFLVNLVKNWPSIDEITLYVNNEYEELVGFRAILSKNKNVKVAKFNSIAKLFICSYKIRLLEIFLRLLYRFFYYPLFFPLFVLTSFFHFFKADADALYIVNGGHPGSLFCRASVLGWRLANLFNGRKVVYNIHNSPTNFNLPIKWAKFFIDKLIEKSANDIITVSEATKNAFKPRKVFYFSNKFKFIHNGIEDPTFNFESHFSEPQRQYILMAANYEFRKGHKFILEAFSHIANRIDEIDLVFIGDNRNSDYFNELSFLIENSQFSERVKALGYQKSSKSWIQASELLVSGSQSFESFGLTLIEAMAFSKPVVVTDVGGMPEVIGRSGAGIVCDRSSPKDFADACIRILENDDLKKSIGEKGRIHYEDNFEVKRMVVEYRALISN